jgi:hypothetical protein
MPAEIAKLVLFGLCIGFWHSLGPQARAEDQFAAVGICEILKDPSHWNGRLVSIRVNYEFVLLDTSPCAKPFITDGYRWPEAVDVISNGDAYHLTEPLANKKTFTPRDFYDRLQGERKDNRNKNRLLATFYGRLNARERYFRVKTNYGLLGNGFGHLGSYPVQLTVYSVQNIIPSEE